MKNLIYLKSDCLIGNRVHAAGAIVDTERAKHLAAQNVGILVVDAVKHLADKAFCGAAIAYLKTMATPESLELAEVLSSVAPNKTPTAKTKKNKEVR